MVLNKMENFKIQDYNKLLKFNTLNNFKNKLKFNMNRIMIKKYTIHFNIQFQRSLYGLYD